MTEFSLHHSDGNTIDCNDIKVNGDDGISLFKSEGNKIINNEVESNLDDGISLYKSDFNDIINNEIENNYFDGVVLCESNGNLVKCNDIINNHGKGILIAGSKGNEIIKNNIKTCIPATVCVYVRDNDGRISELNEVHYNCLIAKGPFSLAIVNNSCKKLNAQNNWFGSAKDPKCKIAGFGVTLYCPWLKEAPANCGCHKCNKKEEKKTTTTTTTTTAEPANVTTAAAGVPMQTTGAPLALLALALLAVFGGLIPKRK